MGCNMQVYRLLNYPKIYSVLQFDSLVGNIFLHKAVKEVKVQYWLKKNNWLYLSGDGSNTSSLTVRG